MIDQIEERFKNLNMAADWRRIGRAGLKWVEFGGTNLAERTTELAMRENEFEFNDFMTRRQCDSILI
jgi:hypothetical protein